jgi:hypothetical protein
MPSVQEWVQALITPQRLFIESSAKLLREIEERGERKEADRERRRLKIPVHKPVLSTVPPFVPELQIEVPPVSILHRLGTVTTPPVENLADLCSSWAYLRYLWAFEVPVAGVTPFLRLSQAATEIDFHQKGLLSDQLGVGIAAFLMSNYLGAPLAADVSVAMDNPSWPIELQASASPDYLFFDSTQASLYVVECKGTQSSVASAYDQLRRGTEQIPSLVFNDGRTPPSLVIATYLSKEGTRVFVIDPPGDEDDRDETRDQVSRVTHRNWKVENEADFTRTTRLVSEAKLLFYMGASDIADRKLERARPGRRSSLRGAPPELVTSENAFGTFRGIPQRLGLRDGIQIELFQALEHRIFKALVSEEPEQTAEEMLAFQSRSKATSDSSPDKPMLQIDQQNEATVVISAGRDGSLLELRISSV